MIAVDPVAQAAPIARSRNPTRTASRRVFLLVGGRPPLLFALSWSARKSIGLDASEYAIGFLMFHAAFVINDPHFAVTYLLFYRNGVARAFDRALQPSQRARYFVAGIVVPLGLAIWAVSALATKSALALGLMIQLMFLLVGWHYVKQGFGVMVVLAARRGIRFSRPERLALLTHCFAGWAYAWASPSDPGTEVEEKGVVYATIAHAPWLERTTLVVLLATALLVLGVLVQKTHWREGRSGARRAPHRAALQHLVVVDLLQRRSARHLRHPGAALGAVPLFRLAPPRQRSARTRGTALVRDLGARASRHAGALGGGARLDLLPRRPCRARRHARPAARAPHGAGARTHPVFRCHLHVRERAPLLHGLRHLAPGQPRDAIPPS